MLGYYFDYVTVAWIVSVLSIVYVACFWFMPETPQHLALQRKLPEAELALRYYRNIRTRSSKELSEELQLELHKLRAPDKADEAGDNVDDSVVTWADFCKLLHPIQLISRKLILISFSTPADRKTIKVCCIGLGLLVANQGCGCFAMLNYTAMIFKKSGSSLPPTVSAIIVGLIQMVGSYVATLLVERAGRKILLLISAVGICLSQVTMASHSYLKVLDYDTSGFDWVPIVAFSFMLFIASWGLLTLPFLVIAELMPPKIRSTAIMVLMSVLWLLSMCAIKVGR